MNKVLAGLQILAKYDENFDTCAEHDKVHAMYDVETYGELSVEDQQKMDELGWFRDTEDEDSWSCFT